MSKEKILREALEKLKSTPKTTKSSLLPESGIDVRQKFLDLSLDELDYRTPRNRWTHKTSRAQLHMVRRKLGWGKYNVTFWYEKTSIIYKDMFDSNFSLEYSMYGILISHFYRYMVQQSDSSPWTIIRTSSYSPGMALSYCNQIPCLKKFVQKNSNKISNVWWIWVLDGL